MKQNRARLLAMFVLLWAAAVAPRMLAEKVDRDALGRGVKLRILVDKVMQPEEKWITKEWMVKEAAEAGFNVFSPRAGFDRLEEVRQVTEWCGKYGIYHLVWMRGSLSAQKGAKANGKRLVWASGNEQPLWSPNSDEFWDWTRRYILEYAKISAKDEHLIGVFLDYENYAPRKERNLYSLSYDDLILKKFAGSKGIEFPVLPLSERSQWLKSKGYDEAFSEFQIGYWRRRCRQLREAVDRYDPKFQFCIYPAPGTLFMVEAIYPEWATEKAPLILADASTYGRSSKFVAQKAALETNRKKLLGRMGGIKAKEIPFIYAGGIDPVVRGADPEFCGKNAVMISDITDGYWIFYEGPKYRKDHRDYFKWFAWANRAIARKDFSGQYEPRKTEEDFAIGIFKAGNSAPKLRLPPVTGETVSYPLVKLRGENLVFIAARKGAEVQIELKNQPVARYESPLVWELRTSKLGSVKKGSFPHGSSGTVRFTPEYAGLYVLGLSAGACAYSLLSANAPIGIYAGEGCSFIYGAKRLYFRVPEKLKKFKISARGAGAETVRLNLFNHAGELVSTGQTSLEQRKVVLDVKVAEGSGQVWSLEITRADTGVLEDNAITLHAGLPPVLSLTAEQAFGLEAGNTGNGKQGN